MAIQIAIGFISDGTTEQIDTIRSALTRVNNPLGLPLYSINGFAVDHQIGLYYLCPSGVSSRNISNFSSLEYFGGTEESGSHSKMRLINFLVDRAVNISVGGNTFEAICLLDDVSQFNGANVTAAYEKMIGNKIFITTPFGWVVSRRVRLLIGSLRDSGTFAEAVQELKERIRAGGFTDE